MQKLLAMLLAALLTLGGTACVVNDDDDPDGTSVEVEDDDADTDDGAEIEPSEGILEESSE